LRRLASLRGHGGAVTAVAFAPEGRAVATGSEDGTVKLGSLVAGQEVVTLKGHTGSVTSLAFAPGGSTLASASDDKTVRLWRAAVLAELDGSRDKKAAGLG
jgi:WD40 repeat protein